MTQVHKNHLLLAWEEKNETESFDITKKLVFSLMIGFSTALFSSGLTAFAVPYDSGAWLSEGDYRYVDNGDDTVKIERELAHGYNDIRIRDLAQNKI